MARARLFKLTYPDHRTVRETDVPDVSTITDDRLFSSLWDLRYSFGPVCVLCDETLSSANGLRTGEPRAFSFSYETDLPLSNAV